MPYEALIGKWLNQDRQAAKFIQGIWQAVSMALGASPDPQFLQALAKNHHEAAELASMARARRKEEEAAQRHGF